MSIFVLFLKLNVHFVFCFSHSAFFYISERFDMTRLRRFVRCESDVLTLSHHIKMIHTDVIMQICQSNHYDTEFCHERWVDPVRSDLYSRPKFILQLVSEFELWWLKSWCFCEAFPHILSAIHMLATILHPSRKRDLATSDRHLQKTAWGVTRTL